MGYKKERQSFAKSFWILLRFFRDEGAVRQARQDNVVAFRKGTFSFFALANLKLRSIFDVPDQDLGWLLPTGSEGSHGKIQCFAIVVLDQVNYQRRLPDPT